jgi:Lon protease-like protein
MSLPLALSAEVLFPGTSLTLVDWSPALLDATRVAGAQVWVGTELSADHVGTVAQVSFLANGAVMVNGLWRGRVRCITQREPLVVGEVDALPEEPTSELMGALACDVLARFRVVAGPSRARWLEQLAIPDDVVNFVAGHSALPVTEQLRLLELPNAEARGELLMRTLALPARKADTRSLTLVLLFAVLIVLALAAWWVLRPH